MLILNSLQSWALIISLFLLITLAMIQLARFDQRFYASVNEEEIDTAETAQSVLTVVPDTLCHGTTHKTCTNSTACSCHCHVPYDQELDGLNALFNAEATKQARILTLATTKESL